jgi:hypothetical protein
VLRRVAVFPVLHRDAVVRVLLGVAVVQFTSQV